MDFLPIIKWDILSGWILFVGYYLTTTILMILLPREVVTRLYDRTGFTKKQTTINRIYMTFLMVPVIISWISSFTGDWVALILGLVIFIVSEIGFVSAVLSFKNTPFGEPVTQGLYKISRHPQMIMNIFSLLGILFTVGSWLLVIIFLIGVWIMHYYLLAEEEYCITKYGESYRIYMKTVPRYFLFF